MHPTAVFRMFIILSTNGLTAAILQYRCDLSQEKEMVIGYTKYDRRSLNVQAIFVKLVTSVMQCLLACDMQCDCASVNVKRNAVESKHMTCEVLEIGPSHDWDMIEHSDLSMNYEKAYHPNCGGCRSFQTWSGHQCDCAKQLKPQRDCDAHKKNLHGKNRDGIYQIQPFDDMDSFPVYCDMKPNFGWTVFQRRVNGNINFNRTWMEYKNGFGEMLTDFWLGNDFLHKFTASPNVDSSKRVLQIHFQCGRSKDSVTYRSFRIDSENHDYRIVALKYSKSSTVADALGPHEGCSFKTWDYQNNENPTITPYGEWWFANGTTISSNLNGRYFGDGSCTRDKRYGITWDTWCMNHGECPTFIAMSIR